MRIVLLFVLVCAAFQVQALPIPGKGFTFTKYVRGAVGPGMAMDLNGDLYVISGSSTYVFRRSSWDGVNPFVFSSSSHLLTNNNLQSQFCVVANSHGRIYGNGGCELNKTNGKFERCGIWSNTGYGVSVDPSNDDIIISDFNRIRRVPNPDSVATSTPVHIWSTSSPAPFSSNTGGVTIDGVYMDRQGRVFLANLDGSVIVVNGTNGALIQEVNTNFLSAGVPDGIAVSGDGRSVVMGMTGARMAYLNTSNWQGDVFSNGTGEGYHDFSIVGPDGCIYQSDYAEPSILRVTREDGTCDFVSAVTPSSPCGADCTVVSVNPTCASASVFSSGNCASLSVSTMAAPCN